MISSIVKFSQLEDRLDAEFYNPAYFELVKLIKSNDYVSIGNFVREYNTGFAPKEYRRSGIPILKVRNFKDGDIDFSNADFIDEEFFQKHPKGLLQDGDIVLTTTGEGSIGKVDYYYKQPPAGIVPEVTRIAFNNEVCDSGFVYALLASKYGKSQFMRFVNRATGQTHLYFKDLKHSLLVPNVPIKTQQRIGDMVRLSLDTRDKSKQIHKAAQELLNDYLQIKKQKFGFQKTFSIPFSQLEDRLDGEYYKPKYQKLYSLLKGKEFATVKDIKKYNQRGVQPKYIGNSEFKALTSQYILDRDIDYNSLPSITKSCFESNTKAHLQSNDIVTYTTGAYVGRTQVWIEKGIKAIASNHVNILRVFDQLNPIYVGFVINSFIGQMQIQRLTTGAAQAELYPSDIDKLIIPIPNRKLQDRIAEAYIEHHKLQKEWKELLSDAKSKVEELIEKGEK